MNLEPLRAALSAEADAEARRRQAEAEAEHERRLLDARTRADAIVEQARREGEQTAAREAHRRRAAASRRARELRLDAERALLDELRVRAHDAALEARSDPGSRKLIERLSQGARDRLGPDVELEIDAPGVGGVVASEGGRSLDYSLRALVDRAIDELGGELEGLWQ